MNRQAEELYFDFVDLFYYHIRRCTIMHFNEARLKK